MLREASRPWRRKKRKADDDVRSDSPERITDTVHRKKRKRELKAGNLFLLPSTPDTLTAVGIATGPCRALLSHLFAAERDSRIQEFPQDGSTIMGRFIDDNGLLDQQRSKLQEAIVSVESALGNESLYVEADREALLSRNNRHIGLIKSPLL